MLPVARMRITYLLSYFEVVGGQEFYLARQQAKQGHYVSVIASDRFYAVPGIRDRYRDEGFGPDWTRRVPGVSEYEGIRIVRLPTVIQYSDFIVVRGVRAALERERPDVVFGHEPRTVVPALGALWKRRLGYLYYLDVHDFFHAVQNHRWGQRFLRYAEYFWWRRFIVDYALRRADRIIPVAPECQRFLRTRHGIPIERMDYLPLGVETDLFRYEPKARERTRRELGYDATDVVLLFAGYMFRRKALERLVDLVARVTDVPLRLLYVGEGPTDYMTELRRHAEESGVADRVHFTGFVPRRRVTDFYAAADIGVWPGNNSLVTLEAMACRLPVIMADLQLKHLVAHANGFTVPYADLDAIEARVRELARDPALRRRMGAASERAAQAHYSYAAIARRVTGWMESDLAKRRTTV